jgi:hypothetical protein
MWLALSSPCLKSIISWPQPHFPEFQLFTSAQEGDLTLTASKGSQVSPKEDQVV